MSNKDVSLNDIVELVLGRLGEQGFEEVSSAKLHKKIDDTGRIEVAFKVESEDWGAKILFSDMNPAQVYGHICMYQRGERRTGDPSFDIRELRGSHCLQCHSYDGRFFKFWIGRGNKDHVSKRFMEIFRRIEDGYRGADYVPEERYPEGSVEKEIADAVHESNLTFSPYTRLDGKGRVSIAGMKIHDIRDSYIGEVNWVRNFLGIVGGRILIKTADGADIPQVVISELSKRLKAARDAQGASMQVFYNSQQQ